MHSRADHVLCNPLVHAFSTPNARYLYDASTNEILETDPNTFELFRIKQRGSVAASSLTDIVRATLEQALADGFFGGSRFEAVAWPRQDAQIASDLRCKIQELVLSITEHCNFRCKYCVYSGLYPEYRTHSDASMTEETLVGAIDFLKSTSSEADRVYVGFYGGEPFLSRKSIEKAILYTKKKIKGKEVQFSVTTNGSLLAEDTFNLLVSNNVIVVVSVDGPRDTHDGNRVDRAGNPTFEGVYANLRALHDRHPDYYHSNVGFAVTAGPSTNLIDLAGFFSEDPLMRGHWVVTSPVRQMPIPDCDESTRDKQSGILESHLTILSQRYIDLLSREEDDAFLASLFRKGLKRIHNRRVELLTEIAPNGMCIPGLRRVFVSTSGTCYPCERVGEHFPIGTTVRGLDARAVLGLMKAYGEHVRQSCLACWAARLCDMCLSHMNIRGSLSDGGQAERCARIKRAVDRSLVIYSSVCEQNPRALDRVLGNPIALISED